MKRTQLLQETRKMRFLEVFQGWNEGRLTQEEAARILGVCARTFRRYLSRHAESGMEWAIVVAVIADAACVSEVAKGIIRAYADGGIFQGGNHVQDSYPGGPGRNRVHIRP